MIRFVAVICVVLCALREGSERGFMHESTAWAALWPDRRSDALDAVHEGTGGIVEADQRAQDAVQHAPRRGELHCWRARAAIRRGVDSSRHDLRASRAEPWHASISAESARRLLRASLERADPGLRSAALESLRIAVLLGGLPPREAFGWLAHAGANHAEYAFVAGANARSQLLDHHAERGDDEGALAMGRSLDADGPAGMGVLRAHLRLADAHRRAGRPGLALEHHAHARPLLTSEFVDSFDLDHADALLAAGRLDEGLALLLDHARSHGLSAERIAGSLYDSADRRGALERLRLRAETSAERSALSLLEGWAGGGIP